MHFINCQNAISIYCTEPSLNLIELFLRIRPICSGKARGRDEEEADLLSAGLLIDSRRQGRG